MEDACYWVAGWWGGGGRPGGPAGVDGRDVLDREEGVGVCFAVLARS